MFNIHFSLKQSQVCLHRHHKMKSHLKHFVQILFELVDVGVSLQTLGVVDDAPEHELVVLFHQKPTFKNFFTLTDQLQHTTESFLTSLKLGCLKQCLCMSNDLLDAEQRRFSCRPLLQSQFEALVNDI